MRLITAAVIAAVAVAVLLAVAMYSPANSGSYRVIKYVEKNGDLYCVTVSNPGAKKFLMKISVAKPVEVTYANPTQLFTTIKLVAVNVDTGRNVSSINIVVVGRGIWDIYVVSGMPGTYCFKIVPLE